MTSRKELVAAIYQLMQTSTDSKHLAQHIAAHLLDQRGTKEVGAILRELESLRLNRDGVLEITATSAHALSAESKAAIKALFDAKQIIMHEQQDPSLLGGVKVRAHDRQVDYSVRTRLQRLKTGAN